MNGGDKSAKYFKRIIPPSSSNRGAADGDHYQVDNTSVGPKSMKELLMTHKRENNN